MSNKKFALIMAFIVFIICAPPFFSLSSSFNSNRNWKYREIREKMFSVQYGDAIVKIDVDTKVRINFGVNIKPDYLSKKEAFELGRNLIELINQEIETDENNLFGAWVAINILIHPVPDQDPWSGYHYEHQSVVYGGELDWYFTGNLGVGEKYSGILLSELISK